MDEEMEDLKAQAMEALDHWGHWSRGKTGPHGHSRSMTGIIEDSCRVGVDLRSGIKGDVVPPDSVAEAVETILTVMGKAYPLETEIIKLRKSERLPHALVAKRLIKAKLTKRWSLSRGTVQKWESRAEALFEALWLNKQGRLNELGGLSVS
ncbi:hypothetical protein [Magnetococcus sp. PR-3]|uniref:hypothetical protein n=1 Tax=Magnetococcus sp. PR-3 TaxID=3120355 RepID=UPI002FCDFD1D